MARLKDYYKNEVVPAMMKEFGYTSTMQVPRLEKIIVNMGLGEAIQNIKILESASAEIGALTGQKAVITKARKSIATFKLRQGMSIGSHGHPSQGAHVRVLRPAGERGASPNP